MARMRSVKPEYWADQDLAAAVSRDARLLYIGLWNLADEHGRLRGDPRYVKGQLFAYDDDLSPSAIDALLDELAGAGKVVRYRRLGARYLFLPNLAKHQRLDVAVLSRLPAPEESDPEMSEPDPDRSEPRPDESENFPDEFARRPDESEPRADLLALKHVAGGMEQVAPSVSAAAPADRPPETLSVTQRSKRITDGYAAIEPMSKWPAINGIVIKAIKAESWSDDEIDAAMKRLAKEKRPVTVETLRVELDGIPPRTRASPLLPDSNAPTAIPDAEKCPEHRGERKSTCRQCAALRKGKPRSKA